MGLTKLCLFINNAKLYASRVQFFPSLFGSLTIISDSGHHIYIDNSAHLNKLVAAKEDRAHSLINHSLILKLKVFQVTFSGPSDEALFLPAFCDIPSEQVLFLLLHAVTYLQLAEFAVF